MKGGGGPIGWNKCGPKPGVGENRLDLRSLDNLPNLSLPRITATHTEIKADKC